MNKETSSTFTPTATGRPRVGIVMGSTSDWPVMEAAARLLDEFGIATERRALSAHRTPDAALEWGRGATGRGLQVIIAAAGGAAHLAGVMAAVTPLPVLGVPMESASLKGLDSLLSMVQMPGGIPVATFAIGKPGATNAAILAAEIVGTHRPEVREKLRVWRASRAADVRTQTLPLIARRSRRAPPSASSVAASSDA